MAELSLIGLVTAFAAGVISFLSPCVLPLVPGYVSFVAGSSLEELRDRQVPRLQVLLLSATFVAGFSLVFTALGASATALGNLLLSYRYELGLIAGVIVIMFGLHMLGITPLRLMEREARFHLDIPGGRMASALVLGIAFAFGWTPCIGPVLGARRADLLQVFLIEYLGLGTAAALAGALLGSLGAFAIVIWVMDLPWIFAPGAVLTVAGLALLLTLAAGFAGTWRLLGRPAAPVLRAP
jgi:cytochrome c-type biogenesis protein